MSIISGTAKSAGGFYDYPIEQSLRFDGSSYLSRTPSSAGNRKTWTWSGWVKRGNLTGSIQKIFTAGASGTSHAGIQITGTEELEVFYYASGYEFQLVTTQVLRDLSAWMHISVAIDSNQATSSNTVKIYINGIQVTTFATSLYPVTQYADFEINNTSFHAIAKSTVTGESNYFDGYLANIQFIDGQALTASSFGETKSGVWVPKAYTGSYGTNGFHLTFENATSTTALGYDYSGNNNHWTLN